jgi:putative heme-binding domain-containing protein
MIGPRRTFLRVTGALLSCSFWLILIVAYAGEPGAMAEPDKTAIALEALSRLKGIDLEANPSVKAAVERVLQQVRGRPEFVEIVRDFRMTNQETGLLEVAVRNPHDSSGVEAARLLLEHRSLVLLQSGLRTSNAANLVIVLGHAQMKETLPLIEPILTDSRRDFELRKEVLRAMAKIQEGALRLLKLAAAGDLSEDLKPTATAELNAVRWPELKAEAARLLPLPKALNAEPLPPLSELLGRQGDPMKGAEVFRRETVGCARCHQVDGQGVDFGPNLSEIGSKLGRDALYQAILEPSAGIAFGYEAWQLELKEGEDVYGLVTSETAEEIAIKAVGGLVSRYKKADVIRKTQQKVSAMPSGLEQAMTVQDLVDLVAYLGTLKKQR